MKLGWAPGNSFKSDISITLILAAGQSLGSLPCMHASSRAGSRVCVTREPKECLCEPDVSYLINKVNLDPSRL